MATKLNLVFVPCLVQTATTNTNIANSASTPRSPKPQPIIAGSGSTDPVGVQRWPVKL